MHRITTADQTSIYLKDWGEGSPVVLVRGWPTTAQVPRRLFSNVFSMGSSDSRLQRRDIALGARRRPVG